MFYVSVCEHPIMNKSKDISEEDSALFREAIGNIKPIKQDKILHDSKNTSPRVNSTQEELELHQTLYDSEFEENLLERGDTLFFARPEINKQTIRKLRRGQFKVDEELDLHGMTVEMARTALENFLTDCKYNSWRCVSIIHGKGISSENKKPVIKNKVNNWLQQRDDVLAFCSATRADGGTGAIYLLLK